MSLFVGIAAAVILAAVCAFLVSFLRQPTITGFMIAGLILGYFGVAETMNIGLLNELASIGIALLLFIVGLEMDFRSLAKVGWQALVIGFVQMAATFAAGWWLAPKFGFFGSAAFYIALALTFSSTIVVVKIYSEKGELNSLHGRISLGVLLLQDLVAILTLMIIPHLHQGGGLGWPLAVNILRGAAFVALILLSSRVMPAVLDFLGKSRELLYLFGLAWGLGIALLAGLPWVGLSIEVGGFLAGLSLAGSVEHLQIRAELRPLRDFFLILFFVGLGANIFSTSGVSQVLPAALLTSALILVFKPVFVFLVSNLVGYRSKTSLYTGLSLGQVSEFGLVIAALAASLGEITGLALSFITIAAVVTIFISAYFMTFDAAIYSSLAVILKKLERKSAEEDLAVGAEGRVILVGAHRMGRSILRALQDGREQLIVVDIDPEVVKSLKVEGIKAVYGDIADSDVREEIRLDKASLVISTVPDEKDNALIISFVRRFNSSAKIIVSAEREADVKKLYALGADYVILPRFLSGAEIARMVSKDSSPDLLAVKKEADLRLMA